MAKKDSNLNPYRKSRGLGASRGSAADWASANPDLLRRAVEIASVAGGAVRFGYTRDLGAYSIGIYGDGDPYTVTRSPSEDIDITLQDIIDLFQDMRDTPTSTGEYAKRP